MTETYAETDERDDRIDDPEWLRARYHDDGWSINDIAVEFDVNYTTARYYLNKYDIELRPPSEPGRKPSEPFITLSTQGSLCSSAGLGAEFDFIPNAKSASAFLNHEQQYLRLEFHPDDRGEITINPNGSLTRRHIEARPAIRDLHVYPSLLSEGHRVPYAVLPEEEALVVDLSGSPAYWDPEDDAEAHDA